MIVETKNERQENTMTMNPPRCDAMVYIHFLIAAQRVFTCTEAARCQPKGENAPAHDAFTRLLQRQPSDTEALWREAEGLVDKRSGFLVLDDTTLDKPYARKMDLVTYHWSGKHQKVVRGINLLNDTALDRWKSPHTLRFPGVRQADRWEYEERAFPRDASEGEGPGI